MGNVNRKKTVVYRTLLGLLCYGLFMNQSAIPAGAGELPAKSRSIWENTAAGRMIIEYDDRFLDNAIAQVLENFAKRSDIISSRPYVVTRDDISYCTILERELSIPRAACTSRILKAVERFSKSRGGATGLRPGNRLRLPDIQAERFIIKKEFDVSREFERNNLAKLKTERANAALKIICEEIISPDAVEQNFKSRALLEKQPVKPNCIDSSPEAPSEDAIHRISLEAMRWVVLIKSPDSLSKADIAAAELTNTSRVVTIERARPFQRGAIKKYAFLPPWEFFNRCATGNPSPNDSGAYLQALMTESDSNLDPAKVCEPFQLRPEVHVIDSAIERHPDLDNALDPPPVFGAARTPITTNRCGRRGQFVRDIHHGTFLAGIIASDGSHNGLVGIAPDVRLKSFVWNKDTDEQTLRDYLDETYTREQSQIFLFASSFRYIRLEEMAPELKRQLLEKTPNQNDFNNLFKTPKTRFSENLNGGLNKFIRDQKIVFIVSAGQSDNDADPNEEGSQLSQRDRLAPQNLGDLENVIVATACRSCNNAAPTIWSRANFSSPVEQMVHVAAPGGDDIPGIINSSEVASTIGGTSTAAAYTAGVAARMIACRPTAFARPSRLKEHILLTARPILNAADRKKVVGGILDPDMAMIDPKKTWLKMRDKPIREIEIDRWCDTEELKLREDAGAGRIKIDLLKTRRITRVSTGFVAKEMEDATDDLPTAQIKTLGPGRWEQNTPRRLASIKLRKSNGTITSCALPLEDVDDLILSKAKTKDAVSCVSLPPCEWSQQ